MVMVSERRLDVLYDSAKDLCPVKELEIVCESSAQNATTGFKRHVQVSKLLKQTHHMSSHGVEMSRPSSH